MADRSLRILHVTECYSAGTGAVINQMVAGLPEHEHHLLWHADEDPCSPADFRSSHLLPEGTTARIHAVMRAVQRLQPDVVHAHSSWAGIYTRLSRLGVPVVYQPHCFGFVNPSVPSAQRKAARMVESVLAPRASAIVAVSPHEKRLALGVVGRSKAHVVMVPNRPSVMARPPAPSVSVSPVVSMIGRLSPQKDPLFFAEVARRVRARRPHVRFQWIGGGTGQSFADALKEVGAQVTGWLDQATMARRLASSDLYLHSAAAEGFPISVLDAAASGLPVVVRDIDAFAGLPLTKAIDVSQAADHVEQILSVPAARSASLASAAKLLDAMSTGQQADALTELYQHVTRKR
ncbi:glycosyltransferase family 4 protein [Actinoplanes sp. NPDC049802]|uniref:glycosyltransferase family 4 protein n=1 Tax=Actinoplanes sp. NPDC049802 TaxID=3154742 RepID=UPI0034015D80